MSCQSDRGADQDDESGPSSLAQPLLDAKAAAALLAVRPSWVYEAVRAGKLPHLKIGRHTRFLRCDLENWILDQRQGGGRSAQLARAR